MFGGGVWKCFARIVVGLFWRDLGAKNRLRELTKKRINKIA